MSDDRRADGLEIRDLGPCPLCGRTMIDGPSIDRHHWIPKSRKGTEQAYLHRICHRKIHSVFSEKELGEFYNTPEALITHPQIESFVRWVRKKHPEYLDRNDPPRRR